MEESTVWDAIELIERKHYISRRALKRMLEAKYARESVDNAISDLLSLASNTPPMIGLARSDGTTVQYVNDDVFYSVRWANDYASAGEVKEKIGFDLYNTLQPKWGLGCVDGVTLSTLKELDLDGIISDYGGMPDFSAFRKWCEGLCLPIAFRSDYLNAVDLEHLGLRNVALNKYCEIAERFEYAPAQYRAAKLLMPNQHPSSAERLLNALTGEKPDSEYESYPDANELLQSAYRHGYPCALVSRAIVLMKQGHATEAMADFALAAKTIMGFVRLNDDEALRCAIYMFKNGYGFEKDPEKVLELRAKQKAISDNFAKRRRASSDKRYQDAMEFLKRARSEISVELRGEEEEYISSAAILFDEARQMGNPFAKWQLGKLFSEQSPERSQKYCDEATVELKKLARSGDTRATEFLRQNVIGVVAKPAVAALPSS